MSAARLREAATLLREWWPDCDCHEAERAVADWLIAEAATLDAVAQFNNVGRTLVQEHRYQVKGAAIAVYQDDKGALGISVDTSSPALAVANAYLRARTT